MTTTQTAVTAPGPLVGPQVQYPTPWRVAEQSGRHHIIECADGHYTAEVPDLDLAHLIVQLVNDYAHADDSGLPHFPPKPARRLTNITKETNDA